MPSRPQPCRDSRCGCEPGRIGRPYGNLEPEPKRGASAAQVHRSPVLHCPAAGGIAAFVSAYGFHTRLNNRANAMFLPQILRRDETQRALQVWANVLKVVLGICTLLGVLLTFLCLTVPYLLAIPPDLVLAVLSVFLGVCFVVSRRFLPQSRAGRWRYSISSVVALSSGILLLIHLALFASPVFIGVPYRELYELALMLLWGVSSVLWVDVWSKCSRGVLEPARVRDVLFVYASAMRTIHFLNRNLLLIVEILERKLSSPEVETTEMKALLRDVRVAIEEFGRGIADVTTKLQEELGDNERRNASAVASAETRQGDTA